MRHAERATQASLEAANSHAISLQHRFAQVIAESSRLHQLLFYTQQCLEGNQAEKAALVTKLREVELQTSRTHTTQVQVINSVKRIHENRYNLNVSSLIIKKISLILSAGNSRTS